ncbi:hypothetical protein M422DRAFT_252983 [Sphaerobolus stellatus SS14]|uniref:Hydrophobin n=1 Tax=Sphaerobolus stellatus (strain SS14) TaxID=990650 RepID=A0A0C9VXS6_SPHS4|nr:hypothetical protein M422DRAFT_252983 [Sphaerobolus stellatus SS14]
MKFALAIPVAFGLLAAAAPSPQDNRQCDPGSIMCCNSTEAVTSPGISTLLGLLGIVASDPTGVVGFGCTPTTILGAGSAANCAQQLVCCTGNQISGLNGLFCTLISD